MTVRYGKIILQLIGFKQGHMCSSQYRYQRCITQQYLLVVTDRWGGFSLGTWDLHLCQDRLKAGECLTGVCGRETLAAQSNIFGGESLSHYLSAAGSVESINASLCSSNVNMIYMHLVYIYHPDGGSFDSFERK